MIWSVAFPSNLGFPEVWIIHTPEFLAAWRPKVNLKNPMIALRFSQ